MTNDEKCELAVTDIGKRMATMNIVQYRTKRDMMGIDAYYEIFGDSDLQGVLFAGQIKGGQSYIKGNKCRVHDVKRKHIGIWREFNIPVFIFVYDIKEDKAYWIDAQKYIINNPQEDKNGLTFEFLKKGNELTSDSKQAIINIAKAKAGKLQTSFEKAEYQYNSIKALAQSFVEECQITETKFVLDDNEVKEWLIEKKIELNNNNDRFFNLSASCIADYANGLGIIGRLIEDDDIREIEILKDRILIKNRDGVNQILNNNLFYDFNKAIKYFINYKYEENSHVIICIYNGMEILVYSNPYVSPNNIHILKPSRPYSIFDCNTRGKIIKESNNLIKKAIQEKANILVIGPKNEDPDIILSAMTTYFSKHEQVVLIEDQKTITILSGKQCATLVANSIDNTIIRTKIEEGFALKSDRIIFDIGNFSMNEHLVFILQSFSQRKGCIAFFSYSTNRFRNINDLEFIIYVSGKGKIDKVKVHNLMSSIDYVFILDYFFDRKLYLGRIWKNNDNLWIKEFEYDPLNDVNSSSPI